MQHKPYIAPSRILGEYLDLPELWCDWGLKYHAGLQVRLGRPWNADWNREVAIYVLKNCPELFVSIDRDDDLNLYDAAMGMISQFTLADVQWFMNNRDGKGRPPVWKERYQALSHRVPEGHLQWVPAPETMDVIELELLRESALPVRGSSPTFSRHL